MLNLFERLEPRHIEEQRVQASNAKCEIDRQRSYCAELGLILHQTRERITELRKEANELELALPNRERRLKEATERLQRMEQTVAYLNG